jgi:NUMOD3 motif
MKFQKGQTAWNKGKKFSKLWRKKISEAKKGKPHPHKGYPLTEEHCKKMKANKGKPKPPRSLEHNKQISQAMRGQNNPNYGKTFSEETRQKMTKSHSHSNNGRRKSRVPWNKNKPLSEEHRKKISQVRLGKPHPHK